MRLIQILLCILIILFLIFCLYQFINGYAEWQESRVVEQHHLDRIKELEQIRDKLKKYIESLESDKFAQERLVRKFWYIKPGETVYLIIDKQKMEAKKETDEKFLKGSIME